MPNIDSARKRLRQNIKARTRNRAAKSVLRTAVRKLTTAIEAGDAAVIQTEFRSLVKKFDQAGAKRIIHPNVAARTKSRLSRRIKAAASAAPTAKK